MKNLLIISFSFLFTPIDFLLAQSNESAKHDLQPEILASQFSSHPFIGINDPWMAIDSTASHNFLNLSPALFNKVPDGYFDHVIPLKDTRYPLYISFRVFNDRPDSLSIFVYIEPKRSIQLCLTTDQGVVTKNLPPQVDAQFLVTRQFYKFVLPPSHSQRFVMRVELLQVRSEAFYFWIGPLDQFTDFGWWRLGISGHALLFDSIFFGMIAMMLVYMVSKYIQIRKLEYLYYSGYTLFFLSFFFLKLLDNLGQLDFYAQPVLHSLAYKLTQSLAYVMYYLFAQKFLSTALLFPRGHRIINGVIVVIIAYSIIEIVLFFFPGTFFFRWQLWDLIRLFIMISGFSLTAWFALHGNSISRYLVAGGIALAINASLSFLFSFYPQWIEDWPQPFGDGLTYMEIGIVLELLFFALGLGYKNKMDEIEKVEAKEALKLEVERQQVKHLNALSEVQEQERSRFAKDLHDGLGGMLWGVKLSLTNMKGNMILAGDYVQVFERSLDMLDNSIHELRRVAHNLMPEALVKFGLAAALKDFCDFVNSSKVINVIFQQVGKERRLDMSIEVVLYRVANELVNNALRHSSASEIIIQLNYDDHSLTLTVEDNGKGFDKSILDKTTGAGWPNIRSRIAYLKGSLDVETSHGNGTAVNITIPA